VFHIGENPQRDDHAPHDGDVDCVPDRRDHGRAITLNNRRTSEATLLRDRVPFADVSRAIREVFTEAASAPPGVRQRRSQRVRKCEAAPQKVPALKDGCSASTRVAAPSPLPCGQAWQLVPPESRPETGVALSSATPSVYCLVKVRSSR